VSPLAQILRAGGAGAIGTAFHYAVMAGLLALGASPVAATAGGYVTGALLNYGLSRRFVFRTTEGHGSALPKFLLTAGLGFALNAAAVWLGAERLGAPVWIVQVLATGGVFLFSFAVNKVWTFRDGRSR